MFFHEQVWDGVEKDYLYFHPDPKRKGWVPNILRNIPQPVKNLFPCPYYGNERAKEIFIFFLFREANLNSVKRFVDPKTNGSKPAGRSNSFLLSVSLEFGLHFLNKYRKHR